MRDIRAGVPARTRTAPANSIRQSVLTAAENAKFLSSLRRAGLSIAVTASRSTENPDSNLFFVRTPGMRSWFVSMPGVIATEAYPVIAESRPVRNVKG